jgi:hypothetical protein
MVATRALLLSTLLASTAAGQVPNYPFTTPIPQTDGVVVVDVVEFAAIPDVNGEAARPMLLLDEPTTRRLFVNDMRGPLYTVSYDGRTVTRYVDINASEWGVNVQSSGRERGFQSFALHPQFTQPGAPGYGKFYTWTDSQNTAPKADYVPGGGTNTHHTVLFEWTAKDPKGATYDGGPPREMLRIEKPFANHNGGHLSFNPLATPGSPDFGLLYVGSADGGSGGDPFNLSQNLRSGFGKILRIDPLGRNSPNGKFGIPASNPFVRRSDALPEIYAYGVRNPQRFEWDPRTRNLFVSDIGQDVVEEISIVTPGANLGWNKWEGSYGFISRMEVNLTNPRGDPNVTYPIVEYQQRDPLFQIQVAVTGPIPYRRGNIKQLANLLLFSEFVSGEIFYVHADSLPNGGQDAIRRILLRAGGQPTTFLHLIQEKNRTQGKSPATRADLRFGAATDGRVFLLNKHDGTIRLLVPDGAAAR